MSAEVRSVDHLHEAIARKVGGLQEELTAEKRSAADLAAQLESVQQRLHAAQTVCRHSPWLSTSTRPERPLS